MAGFSGSLRLSRSVAEMERPTPRRMAWAILMGVISSIEMALIFAAARIVPSLPTSLLEGQGLAMIAVGDFMHAEVAAAFTLTFSAVLLVGTIFVPYLKLGLGGLFLRQMLISLPFEMSFSLEPTFVVEIDFSSIFGLFFALMTTGVAIGLFSSVEQWANGEEPRLASI